MLGSMIAKSIKGYGFRVKSSKAVMEQWFHYCRSDLFTEGICQFVCLYEHPWGLFSGYSPVPREIPEEVSFEPHNHHRLNKSLFLCWYLLAHGINIFGQTIGNAPFPGLWYFIFIFFQVLPVYWHKDCHTTIHQHSHLHFLVSINLVWLDFVHCCKKCVLHLCAWRRICVCVCNSC